jgi:hypothetical protein
MCCGQKRLELQSSRAQTSEPATSRYTSSDSQSQAAPSLRSPGNLQMRNAEAQNRPPMPRRDSVSIRSLTKSPIRVRGQATGRFYEFFASRPVQAVDARDASAFLRMQVFSRA